MTSGLFWSIFVLVAMGWFAIGWVARGHENRRYAESRLRALAADTVLDAQLPVESQRLPAPPPASTVVHVHMPPLVPWAPQPLSVAPVRVLDAGPRVPEVER